VYTELVSPVYLVRASILLKNETGSGMNSEEFMKGMELLKAQTEIEDEIGILKSLSLVESTIAKLDFGISYFVEEDFRKREVYGRNAPFTIDLDSSISHLAGVPIFIERTSNNTYTVEASGEQVSTYNFESGGSGQALSQVNIHSVCFNDKPFEHENLGFKIKFKSPYRVESEPDKYFFVINDLNSLAENYREKLEIDPITRESNIVEISLKGKVPHKETLFLNTLMDVYLISELNKRRQLGLKTMEFIDEQLNSVSDELRQAEGSLETFRSRNNILNLSATAENLMKNIDQLESEKSKLELKLKYYRYISNSLGRGDDIENIVTPSTFGLEDPLLNNLLLELTRLNQERIGLKYSTQDGNPVTEVLDLKIANNKKALIENVDNFIDASTVALTDLSNKINQLQQRERMLPRSERELVSIQRKFEFNDNVYSYLLEKRAEAGIAIASNSIEKTIVDKAQQVGSGPVFPNKMIIFLIATLLGFSCAGAIIVARDLMNDNIVTTEDVERSTQIPFIGAISHGSRRDRSLAIVAHTNSELGESFRSLRVNLQYLTLGQDDNVIGITSSGLNEGKTFCSINLAAAIAMSGMRTILIDADMRRPRIAKALHLRNDTGLSSFLRGASSIREVIKSSRMEGLDVVTSGPIPPNPLELLGDRRMNELMNTLRKTYNAVIIDSPPFGYVSEYIILMKYTDANIYVIRANMTSRNQLQKINRLYKDKKIRNVRVLLNDAKSSVNGYYAYQ
jgi:capsular exopolysaccharide synthesis family protein